MSTPVYAYTILHPNMFCIYRAIGKDDELVIASVSYYASEAWTRGRLAYIKCKYSTFGFISSNGLTYRENRGHFSRPTNEDVHRLITPEIAEIALNMGIIELHNRV